MRCCDVCVTVDEPAKFFDTVVHQCILYFVLLLPSLCTPFHLAQQRGHRLHMLLAYYSPPSAKAKCSDGVERT